MRLLYGAWRVNLAAPARPQAGAVFLPAEPNSLFHIIGRHYDTDADRFGTARALGSPTSQNPQDSARKQRSAASRPRVRSASSKRSIGCDLPPTGSSSPRMQWKDDPNFGRAKAAGRSCSRPRNFWNDFRRGTRRPCRGDISGRLMRHEGPSSAALAP
jgi:hypothetical protein